MINQVNTDRIDEAIDSFEEEWSLDSRGQIRTLLDRFHLASDSTAITELIRIDIELRYAQGIPIQLEDYLREFGSDLVQPEDIAQIAFEDFRAREAHGHPVTLSRWMGIPGVDNESWFRNLSRRSAEIIPARRVKDVDETFEAALEAIGFRLIHELGRGAFSQVFLATQNDLADRYVVLKIIDQALSEPENMAMLQHTNIVPIYSFERILSRSVICMPYAGRVTLADFLKGGSDASSRGGESLITTVLNRVHDTVDAASDSSDGLMPGMPTPAAEESAVLQPLERVRMLDCNELALWMFQRLAAALAHSHSRGVLHGDLKPANVLIRNDGEPALLDFNLSQTIDHEDAKYAGGTLPYMSPETYRVVMGQTVTPHGSSDIYSLGVMLYEFVTGRLPYPTPPSSAAIDVEPAMAARRLPLTWNETDKISRGLQLIIKRCLVLEPADRYESAEQLQHDLEREAKNLPLAFVDEPMSSRARKWVQRHPKLVTGGTVGVMLMALIIPLVGWSMWWRNQSVQYAAAAKLDGFSRESAQVLSQAMADPRKYERDVVTAAIKPLDDYGILNGEGQKALEESMMPTEQKTAYRDAIVRHIAQLSIAELVRLGNRVDLQGGQSLKEEDFRTVDRLIEGAKVYQAQGSSRALTFIASERARLAGDDESYRTLKAQAMEMPIVADNEKYLEAVRLLTVRRWPEARTLLTGLADRNTIPSAVRWTSLGWSQYAAGRYEEAKISYTQSLERAPNSSRLHLLRGMCYLKLGDWERAESDFAKAVELEPGFVSAWNDLGLSKMAQDRDEEAIEDFNSGLEYSPGNAQLLLLRARAHENLGNEDAAGRDYQLALKTDNLSFSSLSARSKARKKHGDLKGALADLELAEALHPGSITVRKGKASLYASLDRTDDAIRALSEAIEMEPSHETVLIDRAVLYARIGDEEHAIADMEEAMIEPNRARTLYQAACVHALLGNKVRALVLLATALQRGYGSDSITDDSDLDTLREMPGFSALLKTVSLSNMRQSKKQPNRLPEFIDIDSNISPSSAPTGIEK